MDGKKLFGCFVEGISFCRRNDYVGNVLKKVYKNGNLKRAALTNLLFFNDAKKKKKKN